MVVVHCDLGEMEWPGTKELAEEQARHYGLRFEVVARPQGDILQHVLDRHETLKAAGKTASPFPSSEQRWCTSDHKRGQVSKLLTQLVTETTSAWPSLTKRFDSSNFKLPRRPVRILQCMGMRAKESSARSKLKPFKLDKHNTNTKRIVHVWLPIFDMAEDEVWADIRESGVKHHWAYDLGMNRLSCSFCIYAPRDALLLAGIYRTSLLRRYVEVEKQVKSSFRKELALADVLADVESGKVPQLPLPRWEMA